jgi:hypothetical protein
LNPDLDTDPEFQVNPDQIRIQGFDDQKLKKKTQLKFFSLFFEQKLQFTFTQAFPKGRPSYSRSIQPSKEDIQYFKNEIYVHFFLSLWASFALLDPIWRGIRIQNTGFSPCAPSVLHLYTLPSGFRTIGQRMKKEVSLRQLLQKT